MGDTSNAIVIAIISAGLASLVNCIFQIVNKIIDYLKEKKNNEIAIEQELRQKKEDIYALALKNLMLILNTRNNLTDDEKKENDKKYIEIAPLIRLYATDDIYDMYRELQISIGNARRIQKNGMVINHEFYNRSITLLSRLMQVDIKIRSTNKGVHSAITCPKCNRQHDLLTPCPKCKMTYIQLIDMSKKLIINSNEDKSEIV